MNNESTQNIVPIKDATVDVREIIGVLLEDYIKNNLV